MSLSEFISRNENAQPPDPRVELEQGKLMVGTLIDSGAVDLLTRLKDSIELNPLLSKSHSGSVVVGGQYHRVESKGIEVYKNLSVCDNRRGGEGVFLITETDPNIDRDGVSYHYKGFYIHRGADKTYAEMGVKYNPHDEVVIDHDRSVIRERSFGVFQQDPLRYKQLVYDYLIVECSEPGILFLESSAGGIRRKLSEATWRQSGVLDKNLGELYALGPAKLKW